MPLSTIFQLLVAASFVGGGNRSTRRKPPTLQKIIKMSFNIPLNKSELVLTFYVVLVEWTDKLILDPVNVP
jgi:signal transduction histidine kinase